MEPYKQSRRASALKGLIDLWQEEKDDYYSTFKDRNRSTSFWIQKSCRRPGKEIHSVWPGSGEMLEGHLLFLLFHLWVTLTTLLSRISKTHALGPFAMPTNTLNLWLKHHPAMK